MSRELVSLDFYGNKICAVLVCVDDETGTLRVRHALKKPCRGFSGAFVRDMAVAQEELTAVFNELAEYTENDISALVGLRGSFLSFKCSSGFKSTSSSNRISQREIEAALHDSIPKTLPDTLEVIDILPESYSIDGNIGLKNPIGMGGSLLEADTFLSVAVSSHLQNLINVFEACECLNFQILPCIVAQATTLTSPVQKEAGVLLVDLGQTMSSAAMYYKGVLVQAWEIPFGKNRLVKAVADLLQNDEETALDVLKTYEPGTDEIVDEVIEDANLNLVKDIQKELSKTPIYLQHPPVNFVLTGEAADKEMLKLCKKVFGARRANLAETEDLMTDVAVANSLVYSGALSLISHLLLRDIQTVEPNTTNAPDFLDRILNKLGLNGWI